MCSSWGCAFCTCVCLTCSLKYFSFVEDGVNEVHVLLLFGVGQLYLLCRDWREPFGLESPVSSIAGSYYVCWNILNLFNPM